MQMITTPAIAYFQIGLFIVYVTMEFINYFAIES